MSPVTKLTLRMRKDIDTALLEHCDRLLTEGFEPHIVKSAMAFALCEEAALIYGATLGGQDEATGKKIIQELRLQLMDVLCAAARANRKG